MHPRQMANQTLICCCHEDEPKHSGLPFVLKLGTKKLKFKCSLLQTSLLYVERQKRGQNC